MSEQPGRYRRSASGMVGAMLVSLAVIAAFVAFRGIVRTQPQSPPVEPVDYQQTLHYARGQADFPLLGPASLPKGWRATSVSFVPRPVRWHLGVLTDKEKYVGLEQARDSVGDLVDTYVDPQAARGGSVRIGGSVWQSWSDTGGDYALTRSEGGVTTLVVGTAGSGVITDYVKSLR